MVSATLSWLGRSFGSLTFCYFFFEDGIGMLWLCRMSSTEIDSSTPWTGISLILSKFLDEISIHSPSQNNNLNMDWDFCFLSVKFWDVCCGCSMIHGNILIFLPTAALKKCAKNKCAFSFSIYNRAILGNKRIMQKPVFEGVFPPFNYAMTGERKHILQSFIFFMSLGTQKFWQKHGVIIKLEGQFAHPKSHSLSTCFKCH